MRLKVAGLAIAVFVLAVLAAGLAVAEDGTGTGDVQPGDVKIINTVAPLTHGVRGSSRRPAGTRPSRRMGAMPPASEQPAVTSPDTSMPTLINAPAAPSIRQRFQRPANQPATIVPQQPVMVTPMRTTPAMAAPAAAVVNATECLTNTTAPLANTPEAMPAVEVTVKDHLATVRIENATMADALRALGKEGGFEVKLYGDVPSQPISTEFTGVEVERAALRIMGLAGQKDYFFHYDDKGALTLLETFVPSGIKPPPNTPVTRRPVAQRPRSAVVTRPKPGQPTAVAPAKVRPPIAEEPDYSDQFNNDESDTPDNSDSEDQDYTPPPTPRRR